MSPHCPETSLSRNTLLFLKSTERLGHSAILLQSGNILLTGLAYIVLEFLQ